jgi:Ni/Fe-hydrogenase subunit HybB-like protein
MSALQFPKITLWRGIVGLIFAAGLYAAYLRFFQGFRASTNLTDTVPWGLWVGLGTLCGVGLSAGGFAIAAAVYLLGMERYRPVSRAAVLVAFLGYLSVVAGMMYELGLPWRIWHPIVMWNRHSVLFEVAWCVMLYTTVLALEFAPMLLEKLRWPRLRETLLRWHHRVLIALVLVGVLLSSLHQSFLGGLYLLMKGKLYPLWYTAQLPAMFYLSAIPAGLAVVIMALYLSVRSLNVKIEARILPEVSRVMGLLLAFYGVFRGVDIVRSGNALYLWQPRAETGWFWLEIMLLVILPLILLSSERVRENPLKLYWTAALVVMGFMANRLNVAVTGLQASSGVNYVPRWSEFALTFATIAAAVVIFRFAVLHLNILPRDTSTPPAVIEWEPVASQLPQAQPGMLRQTSRPS